MKYNIRYTSEYIPKLQIHQHSLLTRKVFSWHNSSSLDRHQSWIIIITVDAISSKWCYLSNQLIIGSSTEPTLFHAGFRPSLHVGLHLQHLYPTMGGLACHHVGKAQHLHLTMRGPTCHHVGKAQNLHSTMGGLACHHVRKAQHLHLTMGGTHPSFMS